MVIGGIDITRRYAAGLSFRPTAITWIFWIAGSAVILYSFMYDTAATLDMQMPQPYMYSLLVIGLVLYVTGHIMAIRKTSV